MFWVSLYCDAGPIVSLGRVPFEVVASQGRIQYGIARFPVDTALSAGVVLWAALFVDRDDRVPIRAEPLHYSNPALHPGQTLNVNITLVVD